MRGNPAPLRVALIGAGFIADIHAEILAARADVRLTAVVDPVAARAEALAARWNIPRRSGDGKVDAGEIDVAHVLVPPPSHRAVAEPLLRAGIAVLVEKPMAGTAADAAALRSAARQGGAALQVNQNFIHHPAFARLRALVDGGTIGPLRHVACQYAMPLQQWTARRFDHWLFHRPVNLLLEQAVHPLSQIDSLIGPADDLSVLTGPALTPAAGITLHAVWLVSLRNARATAQLQFSVGCAHPVWTVTAIGEDGAVTADMVRNRLVSDRPTRWLDPVDTGLGGLGQAWDTARQSCRHLVGYALATTGLRRRDDGFFVSMAASLDAFHRALRTDPASLDGAPGERLVGLCERVAAAGPPPPQRPRRHPETSAFGNASSDALVIGGTGFIGRHVVAALRAGQRRVTVLARSTANLPALFDDPGIRVVAGDAARDDDLRHALDGAPVVINLAHEVRAVAAVCREAGVRRLVHVSSIAALDLGDPRRTITGATPPDPRADRRDAYSRAKADGEDFLLAQHRDHGLPVVILRPGVVVGEGGEPFHSGIGFFHRQQHCLGWNRGRNPLPLVLADDVATAILGAAAAAGVAGRRYNVVGDVRLTARQYIDLLAGTLGRPLRYHPQRPARLYAVELAKWAIKRLAGRHDARRPDYRDLRSRGLVALFDTADIKRDLGWQPESDRTRFIARAFAVHAPDHAPDHAR